MSYHISSSMRLTAGGREGAEEAAAGGERGVCAAADPRAERGGEPAGKAVL